MRVTIIVFAVAVAMTGCATTYHRQSLTGGFTESRLDENVFQVRFAGNAYTSRERAADFCLLRCAELAQQYGYTHFIIVDSAQYTKDSVYTTPTTATTTGSAQTFGTATAYGNSATYSGTTYGQATTHVYGGQTYVMSKPRSTNTIVCFKEKPNVQGLVFSAAFVIDSLKQRYGIK
ncbi:MAG: hypothetical protein ABSA97_03045 [Verrucomicrobiia bacterium]